MPIRITPTFDPISFRDRIEPFEKYREYYKENYDEAKSLSEKMAELAASGGIDANSQAMRDYQTYQNSLNSVASALAQGINPEIRDAVARLGLDYNSRIKPIEGALNRKKAWTDRQHKISDATKGRTVFDRNADEMSIDDYMDPNMADFRQINLDDLAEEIAQSTAMLGHKYLSNGTKIDASNIDTIVNGSDDVYEDIRNNYNTILQRAGINNLNNETQQIVNDAAMSGLSLGLGAISKAQYEKEENERQQRRAHASQVSAVREQERLFMLQLEGQYDDIRRYQKVDGAPDVVYDKYDKKYYNVKDGSVVTSSNLTGIINGNNGKPKTPTTINPGNRASFTDENGNIDSNKISHFKTFGEFTVAGMNSYQDIGFGAKQTGRPLQIEVDVQNEDGFTSHNKMDIAEYIVMSRFNDGEEFNKKKVANDIKDYLKIKKAKNAYGIIDDVLQAFDEGHNFIDIRFFDDEPYVIFE